MPAVLDRLVFDPPRWGERRLATPELVETLQDAIIRRRKVRMDYAGRAKAPSGPLVDPWGLVAKGDELARIAAELSERFPGRSE